MVRFLLVAVLATAPSGPAGGGEAQEWGVCVVANHPDSGGDVDAAFIRRVFSLRRRSWPDGSPVHPVNLSASSPLRERFTQAFFGQSVRDQADFWSDRYFHGTRPPPNVASQDAVLLFLSRTEGAVGYVEPARTSGLPEGLRVLLCSQP
jgi:hypothetical protein